MAAGPLIALAALVGLGALALSSKDKAAPSAPGAALRSGTFEFDPNLPPQLEAQALGAIKLGTAAELRTFADQLDAMGYHLTAASLRQRAAELAPAPQVIPPAVSPTPVAPFPVPPAPVPYVPPAPAPFPAPVPSTAPVPPAGSAIPPLIVPAPSPATPPPAPSAPPPGGLSGLDPGMDAQTRQAVIAALTTETDPAKLQGFATTLRDQYPIAAGLLFAKATALIAQQQPVGPSPALPTVAPVQPPPGVGPGAPIWPGGPAAGLPPQAYVAWALQHPADIPQLIMRGLVPAGFTIPSPPVQPPPSVIQPPPAPTPAAMTPLQQAAHAMNQALLTRGYKQTDMPLYSAVQRLGGARVVDGFPGTGTMTGILQPALASIGETMAPVPIYPWHGMPGTTGYDGVNAPTWAEWTGSAAPAPAPVALPTIVAPPPAVVVAPPVQQAVYTQPTPAALTPLQQAAHTMNQALLAHGYKQRDMPLYAAVQRLGGARVVDGFPGTGTMTGILQPALASIGETMAPVPIYPWHGMPGTTGYDGVNAPTWAEWTGSAAPAPAPV